MENEELIRENMERTREALTEKLETLEQKVASSVSAVTETVADVKEKVYEGVETVKDAFDVKAHVDRHPWLMLGGSVLCGYVIGDLLVGVMDKTSDRKFTLTPTPREVRSNDRQRTEQNEHNGAASTIQSWLKPFEPEIQHLKGLALGAALGTVREMLAEEVPPNMAGQLRDIIDSCTKKAGGEPVPSSDWEAMK